jgi:hypothetical protein
VVSVEDQTAVLAALVLIARAWLFPSHDEALRMRPP